jgi:transglutaminase-like putative cysteine protease
VNRRVFMKLSALTAGTVIGGQLLSGYDKPLHAGNSSAPANVVSDTAVKSMDLNISYVTEVINRPKLGNKIEFWIPLPQSDYGQDVTHISIDSPVAFNINEEPVYRNKMIYIGSDRLKEGDRIAVKYKLRRKTIGTVEMKEDVKKHLVLTEKEAADNNITMFVDDIVSKEKDPLEIGRKIYYALIDYLTYDKTIPGCGLGVSAWTFENKGGKCDDFHALFRTMMIYKGIPVKWEQGFPLPYPSVFTKSGKLEGDCTGAHCWVSFYIGGNKWVPVDVSEADKREDLRDYFFGKLSPNRFKVSSGRDLILSPPQKGEPLNTFPFTYAETDGIPLIYGHHFRNVINYELINMET